MIPNNDCRVTTAGLRKHSGQPQARVTLYQSRQRAWGRVLARATSKHHQPVVLVASTINPCSRLATLCIPGSAWNHMSQVDPRRISDTPGPVNTLAMRVLHLSASVTGERREGLP